MRDSDGSAACRDGPVVGIPRALTFYKHAAQWVTFFKELGARVVVSPGTSREILEGGIALAVDESCLPVKIFLGHVEQLIRQQVDYIFVCRQQDFSASEVLCTKLWGLPDVCRNTFRLPSHTSWLELNISPSVDGITAWQAWRTTGRKLCRNPLTIRSAYRKALLVQRQYEAWLRSGKLPDEALRLACGAQSAHERTERVAELQPPGPAIALLGHPYLVYDTHFGRPLIELLSSLGVRMLLAEGLDHEECRTLGREVSPALYWTYNREIIGAAEQYLRQGVDGIILLEAFPCGPDALAMDYASRKLRGRAPLMRLVLDELQSLSGMQTRLESFVDVIQLRRGEAECAHS